MSDWTPVDYDVAARAPECPADDCDGHVQMQTIYPGEAPANTVPCNTCGRPIQFGVRIVE